MKVELVDWAKAVARVFKLAREERDAWVNSPARVAAMMAAELEAHPSAPRPPRAGENSWPSSLQPEHLCGWRHAHHGIMHLRQQGAVGTFSVITQ